MKNKLIDFIRKQNFQPNILGIFINPFYFIRKELYKGIKGEALLLRGILMDFGCGRKPYENLFKVDQYVGVDIEQSGHNHSLSKVDVYYDGKTIPFENSYFDSIFLGEVLEHIFNPDEILIELKRVLKVGGQVLITVPFCWNEHEVPYDFGRYSSFGIKHLLEKHGFEIVRLKKSGNFPQVILQLTALYFFELLKRFGKVGYALSMLIIIPINIIGTMLLLVLPRNKSLYFNNIIVVKKR